jgi:biopolymer transport protein ExbB
MIDYIYQGGWFMLPLLICSILLISIVIERFWFLQKRLVVPNGVLNNFVRLVKTEKISITQQESFSTTSSLGALLVVAYKYKDKPRMSLEEKISEKAADIKLDLERNLNMLGIIASISPLLGLLGTVVGMITVFANINLLGTSSNADFLASGISEALITTAFGLIVAVPGLVFYRMFQHKVDTLMINLQNQTSTFIDFIESL